MAATSYTTLKYQSDDGGIYKIRVSTAKAGLAGEDAITASYTDKHVEVFAGRAGRKKYGIHARGVAFSRLGIGTDGDTYTKPLFIPACTPAIQTSLIDGGTVTYQTKVYSNPLPVDEA